MRFLIFIGLRCAAIFAVILSVSVLVKAQEYFSVRSDIRAVETGNPLFGCKIIVVDSRDSVLVKTNSMNVTYSNGGSTRRVSRLDVKVPMTDKPPLTLMVSADGYDTAYVVLEQPAKIKARIVLDDILLRRAPRKLKEVS